MNWYKRYPSDFVHGTIGMTLEERGAYCVLLDMMYDREGPLIDDPRYIAGLCGCSVRKWKALRERLVEMGKIVVSDGRISNPRADKEIENALKTSRKLAENGAKGGRAKPENKQENKENKDLGKAGLKHRARVRDQKPDTRYRRESDDSLVARDRYNEVAERVGLPVCQKLTEARKAKLRARLKDCGGLEGWEVALAKLEASPFLTGRVKDFRADFDFILQEKSFTKLMEGAYDRRNSSFEQDLADIANRMSEGDGGYDCQGAQVVPLRVG